MSITSIKAENAEGTQFAATINGKSWSGIRKGSRLWEPLQAAIADGAEVAPFVPHVPTYDELRRREYPPIGDQLDAIWKQLNQDRLNNKDLIGEADTLLNDVLAVKEAYPKE